MIIPKILPSQRFSLHFPQVPVTGVLEQSASTYSCTYLGSLPAKIIWKMPTQAPLLPSQYSGLGSSLSRTSKALAE